MKFLQTILNTEIDKFLIVKREKIGLFRCEDAYLNEVAAYNNMVPAFKKFSSNRTPFPNCLYAGYDEKGSIVMLEDLSIQGYKMANRLEGLDFEHTSVVLRVTLEF